MTVGSQVKTLYASIKGIEASLEVLQNKSSDKQIYANTAAIISEIKMDLEKQLTFIINEEPQYK